MINKKVASILAICTFVTMTYGNTVLAANSSTNTAVQNKSAIQSATIGHVFAEGKVTASVLNVRQGPGTNYKIIGQLDRGKYVDIVNLGYGSDWYQIAYGSGYGWVSKQYVKITGVP
ncbi:SH3 domain-containing protein [Clostridium botulinum]|nr:SH3 domain-containing protein [Clostridium botulinum]EKO2042258.1 SH3 domain-containing protein [Clostridium botulinum]